MTKEEMQLKTIPFDVHIPNLDGDGIAETIRIQVQAYTDPETGEDILTPESMDQIEKAQARHMGLMTATDIKSLRTRLGLSQDDMSNLLQIGAKSYTRWESGRARPSRSMNVLLSALRDGQLSINYLRALRDPAAGAEWLTRQSFTDRCLWYVSQVAAQQCEFTFPRQQIFTKGPSKVLAAWQHLWLDETIVAAAQGSGKSSITDAMIKAVHTQWHQDEQTPPSTCRLPTSREQRRAFMNHRFDIPATEDTVSG